MHERGESHIAGLLGRGELLRAYDAALECLAADPTDREARYHSVLALARAGATDRAAVLLDASGLDQGSALPADGAWSRLDEDVAVLRARLDKDRALRASGTARVDLARRSARGYESVHRHTGGTFPAVNAATMWRLAGDVDRSTRLANEVLALEQLVQPEGELAAYWSGATIAEALLLLGRSDEAAVAISTSAGLAVENRSARASTRRQLRLVCDLIGASPDLLAPLANPAVVHYCGHRIDASNGRVRFPPQVDAEVGRRFAEVFEELGAGAGFGSLASGADILAAEALLDRGAELHVWLPFDREEFVEVSVADAGPGWVARFERCLESATSVAVASIGASLGDPVLFDYNARMAMGHAVIRAEHLDAEVHQVALWDGRSSGEPAGTAVDVARWRSTGRDTVVIDLPAPVAEYGVGRRDEEPQSVRRVVRALVFADVAGFSRLADGQVDIYDRHVLTALARTIDRFGDSVLLRETWGDGIYLVLDDVRRAATCALALQQTIAAIDLGELGLGELRGLRVGAHVGPVLSGWDPITDRIRFSGRHVTTTARLEPRTPEGDVYVTEHFAAAAVLESSGEISCQYVGRVPAAKDYGDLPMYLLTSSD